MTKSANPADFPLVGLRVLDLSRVLAGPWASQLLGDLGAEVIKIEKPGTGDDTRSWGPPWHEREGYRESAYFLSTNRNKKSVAVDIATEEGQQIVQALAAKSDVLIENFKVGGLAKYSLDYATLSALNERLIYCSITGFGQTGPRARTAGYDFMIQGLSGLMSITGAPPGTPGGGPQKVGVAVTDILTGLYAANGILAAIHQRQRTNRGQHIDLALFDTAVACLANQALNYLVSGQSPQQMGNAHPNIAPYQTFPTSDGHMILAIGNDGQFAKFCAVAGLSELMSDERFATNAARVKNRMVLTGALERALVTKTSEAWIALLDPLGVPCGEIHSVAEAFEDPQARARSLLMMIARDDGSNVPTVRNPLSHGRIADMQSSAPPRLGEHTEWVLKNILGMGDKHPAALNDA